ncbi:UNKNOWN [Stylonychia lemnae]|uniref:Protein phosphatase n=1 Tax=Stylonychia lemnae TaxID=5949 RepID=A0A078B1B5_STYLE|nr:UNKNOWN [Stylonychia lemnae]|eukprot:CDW86953.1 UNKNOWN [Stylonychia lemnae]
MTRIFWIEKDSVIFRKAKQDRNRKVSIVGNFSEPNWQTENMIFLTITLKLKQSIMPQSNQDGPYENNTFFDLPYPRASLICKPKALKKTPQGQKIVGLTQQDQIKCFATDQGKELKKNLYQNHSSSINLEKNQIIMNANIVNQVIESQKTNGKRRKFDVNYLQLRTAKISLYSVYDCQGSQVVSKQDSTYLDKNISNQDDVTSQQKSQLQRFDSVSLRADEDQFIFIGDGFQISKNQRGPSEDAFFITDIGAGVSDGVGSWTNYGIDCSLFSNTLMRECQKFIQRIVFRQQQSLIDQRVTQQELECHRQALESFRRTHFPGSATATICVLNNRDLSALNLGDSGFILIRFDMIENEPYILLKSKEQQHSFNTPFQLTRLPQHKEVEQLKSQNKQKELENLKKAMKERKFCEDSPDDSDNYQLRVREGDLLILGTDGVFDNLFEEEILTIVKEFTSTDQVKSKQTAQRLSQLIVESAQTKSKQRNVKTPFNVKKAKVIIEYRQKLQQIAEQQQLQQSLSPPSIGGNDTSYSPNNSSILARYSSSSQLEDAELANAETLLKSEQDFESMCYGKGKPDDITVVSMWISHKYNHQQSQGQV